MEINTSQPQTLTQVKKKFIISGYERTNKGLGLKLGTLLISVGELENITKNIVRQLEKRIKKFPINQYVNSIKFCVPIFSTHTKQAIDFSVKQIFENKNFELYIDKKDFNTRLFFVKIILNDSEELKELNNIQTLKLSTGSANNIEKNIRSQLSKICETYIIDGLVVPKYNLLTKNCLENVLKEKFPNNQYTIYQMVTKCYLVVL
jgi:hypothetical protein